MSAVWTARERLGGWWTGRYAAVTGHPFAERGTAALRIGYGTLWTLFLLSEFGERERAWGPGSPWSPALERGYEAHTPMFGWIRDWLTSVAGLGDAGFEAFYALAILAGVLFALGWRTRISALLFCFVVVALENRSPLTTDGGDNVVVLMALFLCFTRCGRRWSLDARRRARNAEYEDEGGGPAASSAGPPEWRRELSAAREQMANVVHNGAVLVIAFQVCVVYATAGLYKVQGSMWQDGTAMTYVLRLHWFQPWPALDSFLLGHAVVLSLVGYVTVLVQIGFPLSVFSPKLKYPALVVLAGMHLSIAVVLGLPFFSLFMLVGDAVFLSDRVWRAVERRVAGPAYAGGVSTASAFGSPTLVFDGDCAFCTSSVHWAERWCRPAVRFVPWQSLDLEAHGLTQEAVTSAVQWLPARSSQRPVRSGAAAVARTLLRSRWPFRPVGALMLVPPFSWLAAGVYRLVARNRYRMPGGTPACAVGAPHPRPSAESVAEPGPASAAPPEPRTTLDELLDRD